ncbi:hypothetical protein C8F01DRAFT_1255685 [Mycena amicta]|nr:hypothetical protein C8F01DRAFT_1255685 [Mycena amicta]
MDNQVIYSPESPLSPFSTQRSKACTNCRRRKIRCDRARPICNQCAKDPSAFVDCEYVEDGQTSAQVLEGQISILQARIDQIENLSLASSPPLTLPTTSTRITPQNTMALGPLLTRFYYQQTAGTSIEQAAADTMPSDLPLIVLQALVHNFIHVSSCFGFFLDTQAFHDAVASPSSSPTIASASESPVETGGTTSTLPLPPVLVNVLYLWGVHLHVSKTRGSDRDGQLAVYEPALLAHALSSTARAISTWTPSPGPPGLGHARSTVTLHTLQATVLLAYYFIRNARLVEGRYHTSVAVSIALSTGMHRLTGGDSDSETINAFWTVMHLNNFWSSLGPEGGLANVSFTSTGGRELPIDTPWPGAEQRNNLNANANEDGVVAKFLADIVAHQDRGRGADSDILAILAKASVLFEIAARLENGHRTIEHDTLRLKLASFSRVLDDCSDTQAQQAFVGYMLIQGTTIQLNRFSDTTSTLLPRRDEAIIAAQNIGQRLAATDATTLGPLDPVLAPIWTSAALILVQEIRARKARAQSTNYDDLNASLGIILRTMEYFAPQFAFMRIQYEKVQSALPELGYEI